MPITTITEVTLACDGAEHAPTVLAIPGDNSARMRAESLGWKIFGNGASFCPEHLPASPLDAYPAPRYHSDPDKPEGGFYTVEHSDDGHCRWTFAQIVRGGHDDGELSVDHGPWVETVAEALRDAATDWEAAGSGGRLASTLRAAATRAEKAAK